MTVRRNRPRSAESLEAELKAWFWMLSSGYDFMHDLRNLGFNYKTGHEREQLADATADAWARLGAAFMLRWEQTPRNERPGHRETPWALEELGGPPGWRENGQSKEGAP
jgi:hypothetical protein